MAQSARKVLGFPARGASNDALLRMLKVPAVRSRISGALARAIPEKVDAVDGRAYVRFRMSDPKRFHPALMATVPVGNRGTLLVIGTPRSAVRKPRELGAFLRRMGPGLKTEGRRSLIYQLRAAGIVGGAETQAVLVPRERVLSAVRMYAGRAAANPILATIGFNPLTRAETADVLKSARHDLSYATKPARGKAERDSRIFYAGRAVGKAWAAKLHGGAREGAEAAFRRGYRYGMHLNPAKGVPGISKWHTYAGGTGAAQGKHSYDYYFPQGRYMVSAFTTKSGRHAGYVVYFLNEKGAAEGGLWQQLGVARSPDKGAALCRAHFARTFAGASKNSRRRNPLTKKESVDLLRHAKYMEDRARRTSKPAASLYYSGEARGLARAVQRYGIKRAGRAAAKVGGRSADTAFKGGAYSNPGTVEIKVPFRDGQKITPDRMRAWVESLPDNAITRLIKSRFEKCMAQYKRFHLGAEPTSFTYRAIPMGSQGSRITDVDMVVSEGKEWAAPYQVPKSSGKYDPKVQGRYIHAHGESKMDVDIKKAASTKLLPERFHTADGKFVGVVPSRNVKITDWYRG